MLLIRTLLYGIFVILSAVLVALFVAHLPGIQRRLLQESASAKALTFGSWIACGVACFLLPLTTQNHPVRERHPKTYSNDGREHFHPMLQIALSRNDEDTPTNQYRFRGPEITVEKPPGTLRVVLMGGSSVLCLDNPYHESYGGRLDYHLRRLDPGRKYEVLNAANNWWTTQHSLINYLIHVRDFSPDVIVLWHGINDLCRSFSPPIASHPDIAGGVFQSDYSHFLGPITPMILDRFPTRTLRHTGFRTTEITHFRSLPVFRKNLDTIARTIVSDGCALVLCTQAFAHDTEDEKLSTELFAIFLNLMCDTETGTRASLRSAVDGMRQFNETTRQVAESNSIPLIDLEPLVPKTAEYFMDECHFTAKGCDTVAQVVAEFLHQHFVRTDSGETLGQ